MERLDSMVASPVFSQPAKTFKQMNLSVSFSAKRSNLEISEK